MDIAMNVNGAINGVFFNIFDVNMKTDKNGKI
jgi:hypothetical protein